MHVRQIRQQLPADNESTGQPYGRKQPKNMIHEITRNEITPNNTNDISCEFGSLVRVVSWIDRLLKKPASRKKKLTVLGKKIGF
jgi:hypothetical protein